MKQAHLSETWWKPSLDIIKVLKHFSLVLLYHKNLNVHTEACSYNTMESDYNKAVGATKFAFDKQINDHSVVLGLLFLL